MGLRVVVWGELFWPYVGGAELFAARLMQALRPRGYEFAVITSHDSLPLPDEDVFRGIPVYRFPFRRALHPSHIEENLAVRRRIATFLRDWAPQVVHLNGVTPSAFYCVHALKGLAVPLFVRLNRELLPHQKPDARGTLLEHALLRANWVSGVSAAILAQARALVPDIAARSHVIHNGVDTPAAAPPAAAGANLLCLGRLVPDKGFDIAVDAFAHVRPRWPAARLIIAGDGPERAALERQVAAHGLADAVEFTGWIAPDRVAGVIAQSAMVIMPSREDGLPNVALQAAAQAVPIVCSGAGGLPEAVRHEETGVIVPADAAAFAGAMVDLLARPDVARRMGLAGWRRARASFDQRRCIDAYDTVYRRIVRVAA